MGVGQIRGWGRGSNGGAPTLGSAVDDSRQRETPTWYETSHRIGIGRVHSLLSTASYVALTSTVTHLHISVTL